MGEYQAKVDFVIEIATGRRNKREDDHVRHVFQLDRRLFSATASRAEHGFIPDTLAEDGDSRDAPVLVEDPTLAGCHVLARPVAVFWITDENGADAKLIGVPSNEPGWHDVSDLEQLRQGLAAEIQQFFDISKELEPGNAISTKGYEGRLAAMAETNASRERFDAEANSCQGGLS